MSVYYSSGHMETYRLFVIGARLRTPILYDPNKRRPLCRVSKAVLWQAEVVCHKNALPTQTKLYQCVANRRLIITYNYKGHNTLAFVLRERR